MKIFKSFILFVLLTISTSIHAQTQPKVIAVVSKASWCPTCMKNGERVTNEVLSKVDTSKITVVENDLSDKGTKEKSLEKLKALGLEKGKFKSTGLITFVDATTKKVLSSVNISKTTSEIQGEFDKNSKM
jgi:ABC-type Na+ efflux pump permease subunit